MESKVMKGDGVGSYSQSLWNYFRAGGIVQVEVKDAEDLARLDQLDQKLWMALAMPTRGISCDTQTLDFIDTDQDGRIRPPEIIAAIKWLCETIRDPGIIFKQGDTLPIDDFKDEAIKAGALRALAQLGRSDVTAIGVTDLELAVQKLNAAIFNGDGIIIAESGKTPEISSLIEKIIARYAAVNDRSGKQGINQEIVASFFADLKERADWYNQLEQNPAILPLDMEATLRAHKAYSEVKSKIDDYFTRCRWVAYDPRAEQAANRYETDFIDIAKGELSVKAGALAAFPLARISASQNLPLNEQLNPAWHDAVQVFIAEAMVPVLGYRPDDLDDKQWATLKKRFELYEHWLAAEPQNKTLQWNAHEIKEILGHDCQSQIEELIQYDLALAPEFASLSTVLRALLYRRDMATILRNFVNFSDFYKRQGAIFQTGTLYIDGRTTELCIEVMNPGRHASMAALSGAYLVYCDCHRLGQPSRSIVALMTDGDSDNLIVGRNGVFYDRSGLDWDATITKIVANPISLREAFWLPYKKLARFVEDQVAKRAAAAESANTQDLSVTAETLAHVDKRKPAESVPNKKIDVGTVAALGVALGSISTFFGLVFSRFLDLGILMPFGVVALILLVSGPSMVLAWLKLKSRNLGPILDANGWAVNTVARLNVPFASSMTALRSVPMRPGMLLPDPYAEKRTPWKAYAVATVLFILLVGWSLGKLDRYLPQQLLSQTVFHRASSTMPHR
jgi:hypothetical protein